MQLYLQLLPLPEKSHKVLYIQIKKIFVPWLFFFSKIALKKIMDKYAYFAHIAPLLTVEYIKHESYIPVSHLI